MILNFSGISKSITSHKDENILKKGSVHQSKPDNIMTFKNNKIVLQTAISLLYG